MAHSFKTSSGKKAFLMVSEPQAAGEYILNKKNKCTNIKNKIKNCYDSIDRTQLYINLYTKLDLSGVPVILDFSGNQVPSTIDLTSIPYLRYDIDPSGNLFGNTTCGINNFEKYMVYDVSNNIK